MTTDLEEQEDELLALQSIFGAEFFREESKSAGEIRVSVELPADFNVVLKDGERLRQYDISFLPPLLLTFELPEDYPSSSPPSFTLICSWLTQTQLVSLSAQLGDLYQATGGAVVLFSWIQFLREDALKFLDIHSLLELPSDQQTTLQHNQDKQDAESSEAKDDEHASKSEPTSDQCRDVSSGDIQQNMPIIEAISGKIKGDVSASFMPPSNSSDLPDPCKQEAAALPLHPTEPSLQNQAFSLTPSQMLLSQILIHDAAQKQKVFSSTVFDCGVCYMGWLGSECVQLYECGHIFCQACLREFCKVQIAEGNVRGVTCPQAGCTATPTPAQVKSIIGEELFSRYDRLLLQSTLDSMSDVTYCPRHSCGSAVIVERSSTAALCSVCSFAFCVACKKTYHGTTACPKEKVVKQNNHQDGLQALPQSDEGLTALLEDYNTGSKQRRHLLESRYGRKVLLSTINTTLSDMWKAVNTKPCPHCFRPIQKDGGCNNMYCTQCRRPFSWV